MEDKEPKESEEQDPICEMNTKGDRDHCSCFYDAPSHTCCHCDLVMDGYEDA